MDQQAAASRSLLYISTSEVPGGEADAVIAEIIASSRRRNRLSQITGALMYTELNFVQFIEGSRSAIGSLLARLQTDPRHRSLRILYDAQDQPRRFADWNLAYFGPHLFIAPYVEAVLAPEPGDATARLMDAMAALALGGGQELITH